MKRIARMLAVLLVVCLLTAGAALAEGQVTFLLPINYFCVDDDQTVSTQQQLDEHSKDGLLYEFTADGQIRCTVTDQAAALQAVILDMENTFTEAQDPNGAMYAKSFRKLEYNADLSEITVICNKDDWGFLDSFYGMFFLANARDYQLYSGVPANELKSMVRFVDEGGEVIYTDNLAEYMDVEAEEVNAETEEESVAAGPVEPSSTGDGKMPYDQVLRLIKWIDDGYYKYKTYEEIVAFTGVEGLDKGHRDTSMTSLGDHYFDWIADSEPTHFVHVCFRGRDASGRFEACQWNSSGFKSEEWANVDLSDWVEQNVGSVTVTAAPTTAPTAVPTPTPEPQVTTEPVPVVTETPAPVATEAPVLTDEFAPNDPIEFVSAVSDRPASWQEYAFTNELNGITLTFCIPMDADTVTNFYANKEPTFNQNNGRAAFYWKYDIAEKTGMRIDITQIYPTTKAHEIKSLMGHNADGNKYTTLKTDRGMTIYRKVNDRGEARWAIVSDPLSDGSRVLALVEVANRGRAGEPWYEAIMQAFEGTVQLIIPGEQLNAGSAQPVVTEVPATPVPATEAPATEAPATAAPATPAPAITAGSADYVGTWYSTWMKAGGMDSDPRKQFGLTIVLTLNEDGTGDFDYFGSDGGGTWGADEEGIVRYWGDGTALSFLEDGSLCWGSYLSGYILFSHDQSAEAQVFPADPMAQITAAPIVTPVPQSAADNGASASGAGIPVGVKYVAKTYTAAGVSMDASMMGGEYAIQLNDDGTATFTMAGTPVPGYSWQQADDCVEVGAYGSVIMTLTMQEDGSILMDYSHAFTLLMVAEQ